MAVRIRGRGRGRRMPGRMAAVKAKIASFNPPAKGLRRKGRAPGSGLTARSPKARTPGSATPPAPSGQTKRLTGAKPASPAKSLETMRAAAKSRATSGGSATSGTGPTPATTPRPGKSAMAASRTGQPPAHGARRKGKTPGKPASSSPIQRGGGGGPVTGSVPVGSVAKVKRGKAYGRKGR